MSTGLLPEYVPPIDDDFTWQIDDDVSLPHHKLFFKDSYSGISIHAADIGGYLIYMGDRIIVECQTIQQAQGSAQNIGAALRDKLPIPDPFDYD